MIAMGQPIHLPEHGHYLDSMRRFEDAREEFELSRDSLIIALRQRLDAGMLSGGQRLLLERELRDLERAAKEAVIG